MTIMVEVNKRTSKPKKFGEREKRVGANFKRLMKERGWSVQKTAEMGNVDESSIRQLQTGNVGFGKNAEKKWAEIFKVDPIEFFSPINEELQQDISRSKRKGNPLEEDLERIRKVYYQSPPEDREYYEKGIAELRTKFIDYMLKSPNRKQENGDPGHERTEEEMPSHRKHKRAQEG